MLEAGRGRRPHALAQGQRAAAAACPHPRLKRAAKAGAFPSRAAHPDSSVWHWGAAKRSHTARLFPAPGTRPWPSQFAVVGPSGGGNVQPAPDLQGLAAAWAGGLLGTSRQARLRAPPATGRGERRSTRWGWQERERAQPLHITLLCGVLPATLLAHSVYAPHVPPAPVLHRPPRLGQLPSSYYILGGRAARSELAAGLAAAPRGALQCARTSLHQCLVSFRGLPGLHRQTLLPLLCLPP